MVKIAVLVSGGGTNLQSIIDASSRGEIPNGEISLVVASNDKAFALERAKKANVSTLVIRKKDFSSHEEYEKSLIKSLNDEGISLVVLAGFMTVLSPLFCKAFADKIINVHPSLIPSFCGDGYYGMHVHEAVLEKGVKVTGATVHFVNEICDGGAIIAQKAVEVLDGDTPQILQKRVMTEAEHVLLPKVVSLFCDGKIKTDGIVASIIL